MDIDDGERYAAAALFTLALHTTQVESGVDEAGNPLSTNKAAWGCPDEELFDDVICIPEEEPWPGMEVPKGFWGFDCCAPKGLCRRVYRALDIAQSRWPGLLKMPDVSAAADTHEAQVALVALVRRYGRLLDPALAAQSNRGTPVSAARVGGLGRPGSGSVPASPLAPHPSSTPQRRLAFSEGAAEEGAVEGAQASEGTSAAEAASGQPGCSGTPGPPEAGPHTGELQQAAALTGGTAGGEEKGSGGGQGDDASAGPAALAAAGKADLPEKQHLRCATRAGGEAGSGEGKMPVSGDGHAASGTSDGLACSSGAYAEGPRADESLGCGKPSVRGGDEPLHAAASGTGQGTCDGSGDGGGCSGASAVASAAVVSPRAGSPGGGGGGGCYRHDPTHQSVMALYELIGACLRAAAAVEAEAEAADGETRRGEGTAEDDAAAWTSGGGAAADAAIGKGPSCSSGGAAAGGGGFFSGKLWGRGKAAKGGAGSQGKAGPQSAVPAVARVVRRPLLRWYDARARVALRRFCHWLHIPAAKLHALEQMWALQTLRLATAEAGGDAGGGGAAAAAGGFNFADGGTATAWRGGATRYATYLKISAGALGGAALLALTGGLAAPAIAAGLGSAIVALQGGAAAATAVTTLGASTAGIAAITGTFGVIGASHAGSKAADLYGDLREFGFWSISAPCLLPPPPSSPRCPEEGAEGEGEEGVQGPASQSVSGDAAAAPVDSGACTGSDSGRGNDRSSRTEVTANADERHAAGVKGTAKAAGGVEAAVSSPGSAPCTRKVTTSGRAQADASAGSGDSGGSAQGPPAGSTQQPQVGSDGASSDAAGEDEAAGGTGGGGALPPAFVHASRSDPRLAHDGLFVPALLLDTHAGGVGDGEDGTGGGDGGCGGDDPLLSPAALFMLSPVSPYPPAASEAAGATAAAPPAEVDGNGQPLAAAADTTIAVPVATACVAESPAGGAVGSSEDDSRGDADGGRDSRIAAVPGLGGSLPSHQCQVRGASGANGGDGGWEEDEDDDPWSAELTEAEAAAAAAPPSVALRARIATAGGGAAAVEASYVEALLAEMDAEAADLDGDGDATAAAAVAAGAVGAVKGGTDAATATLVAPKKKDTSSAAAAGTAGPGSGSIWRWFRSGKAARADGSSHGRGGTAGAAGAAAVAHVRQASSLRPLLPVPVDPRRSGDATLALTIAVNGWVKRPEDFVEPWRPLPSGGTELWGLVWESDVLSSLGGALRRFIRDKALEESSKMVLRLSVSTALVTAMMLPMAVMSAINITIGSRWRVALRRAQLAGRCLAHLLMQGAHGDRPVTLIGFSMGARLIFHCLLELSRCGARGLVESAVLLGTPVSANEARWRQARAAVSGRLVNAFSSNDWVLGVVFRAHSRTSLVQRAAGTGPVAVAGVENTNLSALIAGHTQYLEKLDEVLSALNLQAGH